MDFVVAQLLVQHEFFDTGVGEVPGAGQDTLLGEEAFAIAGDFDFLFPVGEFSRGQAGERAGVTGDDQPFERLAAEDAADE